MSHPSATFCSLLPVTAASYLQQNAPSIYPKARSLVTLADTNLIFGWVPGFNSCCRVISGCFIWRARVSKASYFLNSLCT
ncbi:hypothetical protein FN846DRAFT_940818 [Sphaerosporella brunnea]|uniref:Secreted protein n=1 Tax=Sphaerosporella brunnea TaxID=1250544 RepID=A0A5J5F1V2_9PEZI|nr:hypothetical protein FN846DRAFT_940818 [Sphaerosporella brunnea]